MMATFDTSELELIRGSLRNVLDSHAPAAVPAALVAEGWTELVANDAAAAITALAEEAGRMRSSAPVLDLAVFHGAGLAADASTVAIVDGYVLAGADRGDRFIRVTPDGIVVAAADSVELGPAGGFDPALGLAHATVTGTDLVEVGDRSAAAAAIAAGRRALASQMVGAVEQMLVDTLAYVTERHQYDRAIGSFQTVKHRLADVKVAATVARAGIRTAWESADGLDGETLSIAAKCLAGRAQQLASTHCFQVHGGIAFTVEHGFHQWVRRGLLLDQLLGGHERLTAQLGRTLIATGRPPRLPGLT